MNKKLNINAITLDPRLQSRVKTDEEMVKEFAEKMQDGHAFPPLTVYLVDGADYYLTNGWHRILAWKQIGRTSVDCVVHEGTWRDAKWASLSANNDHGLRPSPADKRKKIMDCLEDEEWSKMSDKMIADQCGCSRNLVLKVRNEVNADKPDVINFVKKDGKVVKQDITTKTSKSKTDKPAKQEKKAEPIKEDDFEEPEFDQRDAVISDLEAEKTRLEDRLAIAAFDATDEEKSMAEQTISDLRERIRVLEIELVAVKTSRDTFQKENAEMKKQIFAMQKKIKSLESQ